jgi:SAM-dependent methyltransferase
VAAFHAANLGRDQASYQGNMAAAEESKAEAIIRHLEVPEGGAIKDLGAGTGGVAEILARHFSRATVYAQDISEELLAASEAGRRLSIPVYGDARQRLFSPGSLDAVVSSTCFHEIRSFGGLDGVREALAASFEELVSGGMIVIRDMVVPDRDGEVYLRLPDDDGRAVEPVRGMSEKRDYAALSTLSLFKQFHADFAGGEAFEYQLETVAGQSYVVVPAEWAYEFYMRKDYRRNYANEIHEKYGPWRANEAVALFKDAGFEAVEVHQETNSWIVENRLRGKVALFVKSTGGELEELPFFPTHATIVARKPGAALPHGRVPPRLEAERSYPNLLAQMRLDPEAGELTVAEHTFKVEPHSALHGTKRSVFYLSDYPELVLKVPRLDGRNAHNCFKAMAQTIARQEVLAEYDVPSLATVDYDRAGPPDRYLLQERLPAGARCAADLILRGELTERDVQQLASIVNRFELAKQYQLDTNPYNWYRVLNREGQSRMVYADGKVYRYEAAWRFGNVGLLQWLLPELIPGPSESVATRCAQIPLARTVRDTARWWNDQQPGVLWWKRHLDSGLWPGE